MPRSSRSWPSWRERTSSPASVSETSVYTANQASGNINQSKPKEVPDTLAGGAAHAVAMVGRPAAGQVRGLDFVFRHVRLGLDDDALGLAAIAQLVDHGAVVLVMDALDPLVPAPFQCRR